MKSALITGISGQDGSYLAEYLLELGYQVWGMVRREPASTRWLQPSSRESRSFTEICAMPNRSAVAFQKAWPDEVYNLAGQVFVPTSWEVPAETFDINVGGLVRLAADRGTDEAGHADLPGLQFGNDGQLGWALRRADAAPADLPYGTSKMAAHRLTEVYRQRGLFAVGGILFNHESPRRGPEMVTRKISRVAARWLLGRPHETGAGEPAGAAGLGVCGRLREGHARHVAAAGARDYVIGTGVSHSVVRFSRSRSWPPCVNWGRPAMFLTQWTNGWRSTRNSSAPARSTICAPTPAGARSELGWEPQVKFKQLVRMMLESDLAIARAS